MIVAMIDSKQLIDYGKRLYTETKEDDISGAAAELSYRFFLALFPLLLFIAALGGFAADLFDVRNPTDELMNLIGNSLPADAASVLRGQLENVVESRNSALLSVSILGAIWSASAGVGTVMKTMNRAYEVKETRKIWERYLLAVGITILGGLFTVGSLVLLFAGQVAGTGLARDIGFEDETASIFIIVRWPIAVVLLTVATAFMYWAAPNVKLPFKWITPGSVLFIAAWLAMSYLFTLYVSNFGSYNATYGTLGGIVVLMVWFYLTAYLLLLGAELNALLAQEAAPEKLPQTAAEGATTETVPPHKKEEARERSGVTGIATAPTSQVTDASGKSTTTVAPVTTGSLDHSRPPSKVVTAVALLVAALTFWRVASSQKQPSR
jgi:membrane protein